MNKFPLSIPDLSRPILALDSSTVAFSCALHLGADKQPLSRIYRSERGAKHTSVLLPLIDELFSLAGIDFADLAGIVVGIGPGGFTGLRVSAAAASAFASAWDLPLGRVSSLGILAASAGDFYDLGQERILGALDARMDEVYCGFYAYSAGVWSQIEPDRLLSKAEFSDLVAAGGYSAVLGSGGEFLLADRTDRNSFGERIFPQAIPDIGKVFALWDLVTWQDGKEPVELNYLRNEVADKSVFSRARGV